jgi:hypothetical protein
LKDVKDVEVLFLKENSALSQAVTDRFLVLSNRLRSSVNVVEHDFHKALLALGEPTHFIDTFLNFGLSWLLGLSTIGAAFLHATLTGQREWYSELWQLETLDESLRESQRLIGCLIQQVVGTGRQAHIGGEQQIGGTRLTMPESLLLLKKLLLQGLRVKVIKRVRDKVKGLELVKFLRPQHRQIVSRIEVWANLIDRGARAQGVPGGGHELL